jgi:Zn-dependent protease with chaperone function
MARALARAHALSDETRLRLFGRSPWRWLLSPLSWRMPTHPPIAKRIARLKSMA